MSAKNLITFSDRLNWLCDEAEIPPLQRGRTVSLSKQFKVGGESVRKWLNGENMPRASRVHEIASYFNASPEWLFNNIGEPYDRDDPAPSTRSQKVPVIKWEDISKLETHEPSELAEDWLTFNKAYSSSTFALNVIGDSMCGPDISFPEGSALIVDPDAKSSPKNLVVAKIAENKYIFRKLSKDTTDDYLIPLNTMYNPITIDHNTIIIGYVLAVFLIL